MKNLTYLIFAFLILTSCENMQTVIDLELPPHEPKLVINSSNKIGDKFKVYVSHSIDPLSNKDFEFYSDASVVLLENGLAIDSLIFIDSSHFYKSNVLAENDKDYSLRVSHPNFPIFNTKALTAPVATEIKSVNLSTNNTNESGKSFIEIEFDDDPTEENFYLLKLVAYSTYVNENGDSVSEILPIYFESSDPSISNGALENVQNKIIFNDQLFNGQNKRIELSYSNYFYQDEYSDDELDSKFDSIMVNLSTLDYDFYTYHTTRTLQNNTSEGAIFGSEPVNVYNSFINDDGSEDAYGLFSIISKDTFMIDVD